MILYAERQSETNNDGEMNSRNVRLPPHHKTTLGFKIERLSPYGLRFLPRWRVILSPCETWEILREDCTVLFLRSPTGT